jgi:hypothetical protein
MRYPTLCTLLILCFFGPVFGGEADVVAVEVKSSGKLTYNFNVTVSHADQGWDHYADRWEIIAPDGEILATRVLAHPHTNEQPFTRSHKEDCTGLSQQLKGRWNSFNPAP